MDRHSKEWDILRRQGKKHRREKAVLYAIIFILIIALVLSNIVWYARHNNETANAEPEIKQTTEATPLFMEAETKSDSSRRKKREFKDTGD